ncbi:MAG: SUMF1/EgtB/PvdO family nonheme iron enzyme [Lewinellaceae bacterium]|nr:SUMF1/EgtB/PvdO family nonheme iron enzyme [Lewinellaceae bacterium]
MAKDSKKGIAVEEAERPAPQGANYLLAVAINTYEHHPKLSNCVRDAERLVKVLQDRYGFHPEEVITLFDKAATAANLYKSLVLLSQKVTPQDNVVIYFSGHGFFDRSDQTGHLVPVEASEGAIWHYFSNANLVNRIRSINSFHTFLIVDSCFSGSLFASKEVSATPFAEKVEGLPSRWALAAGQIETVEDGLHGDHSPFATALLAFLETNSSPLVPASDLIQHVKRVTPHNARQTPVGGVLFKTGDVGGEFVFRLKQDEAAAWAEAQRLNTLAGYRQFLEAFPGSFHTQEAGKQIAELEETAVWESARRFNTVAAYNQYLDKYPNGKKAREAIEAMEKLEETSAWNIALGRNTVAAFRKYTFDYPWGANREEAEKRIRAILDGEREPQVRQGAAEKAKAQPYAQMPAQKLEKRQSVSGGFMGWPLWLRVAIPIGAVVISIFIWQLSNLGGDSGSEPRKAQRTAGSLTMLSLPKADMVLIHGGEFEMGDIFAEGVDNEKPVHTATVSDFYLSALEVTFEEYDAFCQATKRAKPDDEGWGRWRRPVINVSWFDAVAYCNWRSINEGLEEVYIINGNDVSPNWTANGYRLPTEAEWEYAARQGGQKVRFGNGKDIADPAEINFDGRAQYKDTYSKGGLYRQETTEVGSFAPNSLGLYDMSGNVGEWCWDWWSDDYPSSAQTDPHGPDSHGCRLFRGGSWSDFSTSARCTDRNCVAPWQYGYNLGFRLARNGGE